MAQQKMPPAEYLRECFDYDPESGLLRWKRRFGHQAAGSVAGSVDRKGHLRVALDRQRYGVHRIAWTMMTGQSPDDLIDHINGVPGDNRWCNLRQATEQQNNWNTSAQRRKSGLPKGVYYRKGKRKPYAALLVLGSFLTLTEAAEARTRAAALLHGEFFRAPNQ